MRQLREHVARMVPDEQHGAIHKRGVHTALVRMLALLERDKLHLGQPLRFCTLTASDLSKAFDALCAEEVVLSGRHGKHAGHRPSQCSAAGRRS